MRSRLRGLYCLTDNRLTPEDVLLESVEQALRGGARIIQYRDKQSSAATRLEQAQALNQLCREYNALLIINDDVELAAQSGAQGVHLGRDDAALTAARDYLGQQYLIGASCYNQIALAETAIKAGADYVAFGRFFTSSTKPEATHADIQLLQQAEELDIPVCAIGGITEENAPPLIKAGADMLAVVAGVFGQPDIIQAASRLSSLFPKH
jgi:thiamine-phosphate pyrophosphorylase